MSLHSRCIFPLLFAAVFTLWSVETGAADERNITVVPGEQVRQERSGRYAILIGVDTYEADAEIASLKYRGRDSRDRSAASRRKMRC